MVCCEVTELLLLLNSCVYFPDATVFHISFWRNIQISSVSCCNLSLRPVPPAHFFVLDTGDQRALVSNLIDHEVLAVSDFGADFCGKGSDTSGRCFSDPGYCAQSAAQTALNGNDSVCPQTEYGPASRKSNHSDEEGDVRQMKSERQRVGGERQWEKEGEKSAPWRRPGMI